MLASVFGPAQRAIRVGNAYRLGPVQIAGRPSPTFYLRFSAQDVDTVVAQLRYTTLTGPDPCGYGPALEEVALTYNGRPTGTFRASVATDSLSEFDMPQRGRVVKLRKRP
ncbi:MAG: hypothetical protein M3Y12_05805 [Bacteroidota bacterium]|nr:hypothetical protein [Bacteroidota bacterium]